jgi:hypothetical protein
MRAERLDVASPSPLAVLSDPGFRFHIFRALPTLATTRPR